MRVLLLPLVVVLLGPAGCSSVQTFSGDRPASQIAVIVPETTFNRARSAGPFGAPSRASGEVFLRVDGRSLGGFSNKFDVLPGRHQLTVVFVDQAPPYPDHELRTRQVVMTLDAQAGRVYAVRGRATYAPGARPMVRVWVEDGATRQIVASMQVPDAGILLEDQMTSLDTD